ncbi:unnamed protein product [Closterium sp. NIES-53]
MGFLPLHPPGTPPSEWIAALHERGIREISIVGDSHQRYLAAHHSPPPFLSKYPTRWAFYRCTHPETPSSDWIGALHERGIREISIVGDSHQRYLAAHLHFLLTRKAERGVKRWRDNLVFYPRDSSNRTLRINFYWIDGIYKNGEFGCATVPSHLSQFPHPPFASPPSPSPPPSSTPPPLLPTPANPSPPLNTSHRGMTTNRSEAFPDISSAFEAPQKIFLPPNSPPTPPIPTLPSLQTGATDHHPPPPPPFPSLPPLPPSTTPQPSLLLENSAELSFPNISTTADVTLFEGGYWAASFCRQPLKALRVHLEEFARWALAAAPAKGRVIFRTIPSFPVAKNRVIMAVNVLLKRIVQGGRVGLEEGGAEGEGGGLERLEEGRVGGVQKGDVGGGGGSGGGIEKLVYLDSSLQVLPRDSEEEGEGMERAGSPLPSPPSSPSPSTSPSSGRSAELAALPVGAATVLDTWQVDAPRYADTAEPNDHHYSVVQPTSEGAVVVGDVGEGQVRAFVHYLLHVLPPLRASAL